MIRTAIAGADSRMAGELIRILKNHPDVELEALCAPSRKGERVDSLHHGLAGECELRFSEYIDPANTDVVFLDEHSELAERLREPDRPIGELRIIDMSHGDVPHADPDFAYGLAEINRRKLVKEARKVVIPRSVAAIVLIALQPLAMHMLLPGRLEIEVECPDDLAVEEKLRMAEKETAYWLSQLQPSFGGEVSIVRKPSTEASDRGMRIGIRLPLNVDLKLLKELYDEQYDDHNFTFAGDFRLDYNQVEGTDKCLIRLSSPENGSLRVEAVADCRLRGGAGDAVHAMNLLFGLCETTGLLLKANNY